MKNPWSVELLNNTVEDEFGALPKDAQAKLVRWERNLKRKKRNS
jgi:hypothetical protein